MSDAAKPADEKADTAAWLAVAAGTIGALMATLDTSIVNAALPTIQGEIGASPSEGTWVSTAYLVAEIVMIPLAGWLQRIFGLRTLLLTVTSLFIVFSMICGLADGLSQMIIGRLGQGFTGGAMIPTALTIVGTRLPARQQPVGVALFGMTAVLGPVLGPVIGGWLTENFSWHYIFFLNLPISLGLLVLLVIGLPGAKARLNLLGDADLPGIAGLVLGLGGLTVVLEEGQRESWFSSDMICVLTVVSVIGFALLFLGQLTSREPVIRLSILRGSFGAVFAMSLVLGAALYGLLYLIPQFLSQVAGYNAEQSGNVAALSGIPTLLMLAIFPVLVRVIDIRAAIAFGLVLYGVSCFVNADLSSQTVGHGFLLPQLLRGGGQFFSMIFLNQAATSSVAEDYVEDASGLFNAARNLGGSIGLALIATLQDQRTALHFSRLTEGISANSLRGQQAVSSQGVSKIFEQLQLQATTMTFADLFWLYGIVMLAVIPLVLFLRPLPKDASVSLAAA